MWKHWVARANHPHRPFNEFEIASRFWDSLSRAFPESLASVLMPNHLHLILPHKTDALRKLASLMGVVSIRSGLNKLWQPIPPPHSIPDHFHLRRQIRYVALNPCRKKLCSDPLEWYWSTYREIVGASGSPRVSELIHLLKEQPHDFAVRFHAYVSADPSVLVIGTPFPKAAETFPKFSRYSIMEILSAASGALRVQPDQVRRRGPLRKLFVHLAYRQGWQDLPVVAKICDITPEGVYGILKRSAPEEIEMAELCLGDPRLRKAVNMSVSLFC